MRKLIHNFNICKGRIQQEDPVHSESDSDQVSIKTDSQDGQLAVD